MRNEIEDVLVEVDAVPLLILAPALVKHFGSLVNESRSYTRCKEAQVNADIMVTGRTKTVPRFWVSLMRTESCTT